MATKISNAKGKPLSRSVAKTTLERSDDGP